MEKFVAYGVRNSLLNILGCVNVDFSLGKTLTRMKIPVLRDLSNDCLVGREVVSSHPTLKEFFKQMLKVGAEDSPNDSSSDDLEVPDLVWMPISDDDEQCTSQNDSPKTPIRCGRIRFSFSHLRALFFRKRTPSPKKIEFRGFANQKLLQLWSGPSRSLTKTSKLLKLEQSFCCQNFA